MALRTERVGEMDREDFAATRLEIQKGDQNVRTHAFFGEQLLFVAMGLERTELFLQPMAGILQGDLLVERLHGFVWHTPSLAEKQHQSLVFLVIASRNKGGNGCVAAMLAEIGYR